MGGRQSIQPEFQQGGYSGVSYGGYDFPYAQYGYSERSLLGAGSYNPYYQGVPGRYGTEGYRRLGGYGDYFVDTNLGINEYGYPNDNTMRAGDVHFPRTVASGTFAQTHTSPTAPHFSQAPTYTVGGRGYAGNPVAAPQAPTYTVGGGFPQAPTYTIGAPPGAFF